MHRIRTSLPYYREFGWDPIVLAVDPASIEHQWEDSELLSSLPEDLLVERVKAWPYRITRLLGMSAIGLRAYRALQRTGGRMVRDHRPDLAFFSTTAFPVMAIGRRWKKEYGLPYLLDMQDPWVHDAPAIDAVHRSGLKHGVMRALHRRLEPRALKTADGLMAVSEKYIELLQRRYLELRSKPARMIRFGVSPQDWEIARARKISHGFFDKGDGLLHGVCVGAYSAGMEFALRALFGALRAGTRENPSLFERIRFHFIGTSYGTDSQHVTKIERLAVEVGVQDQVVESPARVSYYTALQIQAEADFLLLPGSSERGYVPSRLAGMLFAERPIVAICHAQSGAVDTLCSVKGSLLATYASSEMDQLPVTAAAIGELLTALPERMREEKHSMDCTVLKPLLARELTRKQCKLFEEVLKNASA